MLVCVFDEDEQSKLNDIVINRIKRDRNGWKVRAREGER